jgi:hypothetical protein
MAKLYLFGIGGTGARVLRSFTMMMAAGVKIGSNEIVPIIIDPDASNADLTRTVALMNKYRDIRSDLSFAQGNETQFFRTEVTQILPNYTLHIQDTSNKTFQQFIDLPSMDKASQAMMKMLFSDKNLSSSMDVGFKGNPNIGSVVLNQMVNSNDFRDFANNFEQGDKIFIISSIFGGTGASGFPLLLKTLRTGKDFPNNDLINNAEIGAITVLPYFKLQADNTSEIDSSTFISKTKSALAYYENNISQNNSINALYYLADDVSNTYDNHEGGATQQNDAHLIEFLAATAIVDFSNKQHQNTTNKELGLKDIEGSVSFASFHDKQKVQLFAPLTTFIMMANCLNHKFDYYSSKSFNANNDNFKGLYNTSFINDLVEFTNAYLEWLKEMKRNKRSLDIFNLETGDKPFNVVTGYKAKSIASLKSDYDLVTDRLNSSVKKCHSKEDKNKFLEMFFSGMSKLVNEKFNV